MNIFDNMFTLQELNKKNIGGLTKELKCNFLFQKFNFEKKSIIFVVNSLYEANLYYQLLQNYEKNVLLFPMDDFLTSEAIAVSPELKVTRLETINSLIENDRRIVVTNLMGFLRFLPGKEMFNEATLRIEKGQEYSIKELVYNLIDIGYERETLVNKTGDFAERGFVLDIYPINYDAPIRIEFWGDEIESIKFFDVESQMSYENVKSIDINPNTEFIIDYENIDLKLEDKKQKNIVKYLIPVSIKDYINSDLVFFDNVRELDNAYNLLNEEITNYSISQSIDLKSKYMHDYFTIKPSSYYNFDSFDNNIMRDDSIVFKCHDLLPFSNNIDETKKRLNDYLLKGKKVTILLDNKFQINNFIDRIGSDNILLTNENEVYDNYINIIKRKITFGYEFNNMIVIGENDLFNKKNTINQYKTKFRFGTKIRNIKKLEIGDFVVHVIHGIGKYCGIKQIEKNGLKKDYIQLEYKDGDKVYVPVEKIEFISKYAANDSIPPRLTKLGSIEWEKTKIRVKKHIDDIADDLLKLYSERESSIGYSFEKDSDEQLDFEREFDYVPTKDQIKVIDEIKNDMESKIPMDRLLCGDVGFGKTEVAFRAAFKAIMSGKQVALLCPTTILSSQHYNNAIDRFNSFPINISLLNRFVSLKKTKDIIEKLELGKIDFVIGTHKILGDAVKFKDLGLLIIDEEQRFGVKHKEKIKQYKNNIDVLTLTATPIPRTLQMSMAGIRSLSLIETPPTNRYPVQTYVMAENSQIIKDAIYKEMSRNGQTYILYNKIIDMSKKLIEIKNLVPEAKITIAHGKMSKNEIEEVMIKFINNEYDVLLCTTIIETGIDISNVNTLIIIDSDYFGLSQLYQIRGRVGRSNKISYCYLMYNNKKVLSQIATKRLSVIKDFTELGSGFAIAMRDLSLRGAGDILGSEQAGFISSVGIEMFLNMLNDAVERKKGKIIDDDKVSLQPLVEVSTSIDNNYVSDEELKIEIHNKINTIKTNETLNQVKEELENRFGRLSEDIIVYMNEELFEYKAKKIGINVIKQTKNSIEITIDKNMLSNLNIQNLFIEVSSISRMFRFSMKRENLVITLDTVKLEKHFIYYLLQLIDLIEKQQINNP